MQPLQPSHGRQARSRQGRDFGPGYPTWRYRREACSPVLSPPGPVSPLHRRAAPDTPWNVKCTLKGSKCPAQGHMMGRDLDFRGTIQTPKHLPPALCPLSPHLDCPGHTHCRAGLYLRPRQNTSLSVPVFILLTHRRVTALLHYPCSTLFTAHP